MAQIDESGFKIKMADFAGALTLAMEDDTIADSMAQVLTDPRHPLRQIEKLFIFDPVLGTIKANTPYIDTAYEGNKPSVSNPFDQVANPPI